MPSAPGAIVPAVPFKHPVPLPTLGQPPVTITYDSGWLPYVCGCLKVLVATSTWDPPTQAEIDATIQAAADLIRSFCEAVPAAPCPPVAPGVFVWEDMMPFGRQNPDNPCQFQLQCADGTWETVFDVSKCIGNPAPGQGQTPPGSGGCQQYVFKFHANAITPLPFLVNTGDTIQLNTLAGAGTDGSGHWYCVDGSIFLAGACAGGGSTSSGDPLPTTNHMAVLLKIGSTYYPFDTLSTFTVPSGITNQQAYVLVNNPSLTNNVGDYSSSITFCNNQPVTTSWCRTADFTLSPSGGVGHGLLDVNNNLNSPATWASGSGWTYNPALYPPATTQSAEATVQFDLGASVPFTGYSASGQVFNATSGNCDIALQGSNDPTFATGVVNIFTHFGHPLNSAISESGTGSFGPFRYIRLWAENYSLVSPANPIMEWTHLTISGVGTPPSFGGPC